MSKDVKEDIEVALKNFSTGSVVANATKLFQTLGYNTERSLSLPAQTYSSFKEAFVGDATRFDEDKALTSHWKKVDLLFQLTKEEVLKQTSLFDTKRVDRTLIEAYLFFAIELKEPTYTRTQLSEITRQVNRLFAMPAMIVFQYGNLLTLSVINRRLHKRDESKDVLEKVTLIKDISISNPHRGHTEILFDLSFDELQDRHGFTNFVELHNAWQKTLDTKTLNKKFFNELSNWYHWAQDYVAFPKQKDVTEEENKQLNLIRLITRLIFVWFLKEKGLVQDELFRKSLVSGLVKKFDPEGETTNYYTAILQNLFFATLNQRMGEREFVKETGGFHKDDHGIKNQYRYADQFTVSKEEVKRLFSNIPFLNGGLFDCLDKDNDETGKHEYVDGFSREPKKRAKVSDVLFFGESRKVDLSEAYGYKRKEDTCRGILKIFYDYKFTVEENTPVEEEIALDPELLGRVFENLLAYYAPETKTTARKQTGSFYTPREIVEYMVDESLIAYLKTALLTVSPAYLEFGKTQTDLFGNGGRKGQLRFTETLAQSPWEGREEKLEEHLRLLLHYNNEPHPFTEAEVDQLIFAIDSCKILDPACGSGAFPMGILNKLVYLLRKLDAEDAQGNTRWRSLQKRKAEIAVSTALNEKDKLQREKKLVEINETFENNASDYGRKLYLIETCVYGVDIQPIAVQISKLRFFISLVVDQKEKAGADNRGIRPLPNLETKFVAANTLIGLEKPEGLNFRSSTIVALEDELKGIRHQHFEAKLRKEKIGFQKRDKAIRKKISEEIKKEFALNQAAVQKQIEPLQHQLDLASKATVRAADKAKVDKARKDLQARIQRLEQGLMDKSLVDETADRIASFDIYDQNSAATWFEPEWMFEKDLKNAFDIVLGNPPYISYYSNTGSSLSIDERRSIVKNYDSVIKLNDRINSMNLMAEAGIKLLKPNGYLSFITNKTIAVLPSYIEIRRFVLKNSKIEYFITDLDPFEAIVDCVVFGLKKEIALNYKLRWLKGEIGAYKWKDVSSLSSNQKLEFHFSSHQNTLAQIENVNGRLGDIITINRGVNIGGCFDDFLSQNKRSNSYWRYLAGTRNINRYFYQWFEEDGYMKFDENLERNLRSQGKTLALGNHERYQQERLFIPESGQNLMAAYCSENYYSAYGIMVGTNEDSIFSIKYSCGLINSKLFTFYASEREILRKGKKATPHIGVKGFNSIPVPLSDETTRKVFCQIVDYCTTTKQQSRNEYASFFERLINAMVYELYFPEAIKAADCEVIKYLMTLPSIKPQPDSANLQIITKVYQGLSKAEHPVNAAMFKMDTLEEVAIIEGKK